MNILLPKVVVPGQSTTALVHFHTKEEQHNVTLRLVRSLETPFSLISSTDVLAQNTVIIKGESNEQIYRVFQGRSKGFQPVTRQHIPSPCLYVCLSSQP